LEPLALAGCPSAACLAAALCGLVIRGRLGEHHLDHESRGLIGNITGLIGAMTALLLGLLVANAQGTFNTVSDEVDQLAANIVELDRDLATYGPEAAEARAVFKRLWTAEVDRIWPPAGGSNAAALLPSFNDPDRQRFTALIRGLAPRDEAQRELQRQILEVMARNARTRVLLSSQAVNELPWPVVVVTSSWLVMLFLAFGLLAHRNLVVVLALAVGAASVGGAMFLVLELNRPFGGIMEGSGDSLRAALGIIGG